MAESKMIVPTEKELAKANKKYEKWCELFLNPKSETYGNATQSALKIYKVKKYDTASAIGSMNLRKLKDSGLQFVEQDAGVSVRDLWKILTKKAMDGSYEQFEKFMERLGVIEKDTKTPMVAQQFNFGDLAEQFTKARQERGLPVEEGHVQDNP